MFQKRLPAGDFDMAMYIQVTSPDPTVTSILSTGADPGPREQGPGSERHWYCNPAADKLMAQVRRRARPDEAGRRDPPARQDPRAPTTSTSRCTRSRRCSAYRTDVIAGPVDQFINNPESNFWNMWAWTKK